MADQIGFTVDVNQCISCRACEMACKVEYDLQKDEGRRRQVYERTVVDTDSKVRTFFISLACNHCENPACVASCPDITRALPTTIPWPANEKALYKDTTGAISGGLAGVVRLNKDKCIACRCCEWSCPYGAPQFHPNGGGPGIPKVHKCEFCWQRIESWNLAHPTDSWYNPTTVEGIADKRRQTACSATCLGRALVSTKVNPSAGAQVKTYGPGGDYDYKDFEDYVPRGLAGAPNPCTDAGVRNRGPRTFVEPGYGTAPPTAGDGQARGSGQLDHWDQTHPAIKVCDRVYKKRDGGAE